MSDVHSTDFARQLELAWAAGFFDGEGNTGLAKPQHGKYTYVNVTICQVVRANLERFRAAVGGLGRLRGPYPGENRQPISGYRATGTGAREVLALLWPYLGEAKRDQATRALEAESNKGGVVSAKRTHCPKGHPYDEVNTVIRMRQGRPLRECLACLTEKAQKRRTTDRPHPRDRTECPRGHDYATHAYVNGQGRRVCRTCERENGRRSAAKRQATERAERKENGTYRPHARDRTACPRGHEYATHAYVDGRGARVCRTCQREAIRRCDAKRRGPKRSL